MVSDALVIEHQVREQRSSLSYQRAEHSAGWRGVEAQIGLALGLNSQMRYRHCAFG